MINSQMLRKKFKTNKGKQIVRIYAVFATNIMKSKRRLGHPGPGQALCNSTMGEISIRAGAYCEPKNSQEIQAWILKEVERAEKRGRMQSNLKPSKPKKPLPKAKLSAKAAKTAKSGDLTNFKIPKRSLYERRRDPSPVITKRKPK